MFARSAGAGSRGKEPYEQQEMLAGFLSGLQSPVFYIAGPAAMCSAIRNTLNSIGIDDDDIRGEEFSGY
jgi:ferredoxin-NADP reductase